MVILRFLGNSPIKLFFRSCSTSERIMKYLNVAEKNDAAKNIAAILSRGNSNRREGLSPYNKIYEFTTQVFGEDARMVMTSVSGHLMNYEFSGHYKIWQSCSPVALFDAPVIKTCPQDYERIKKTLEREIVSCQGLIIWTDCDREGENIGFEIIKVCTDIKPNLRIYRAKFSEITATSVFRALNTLGQPNKNISDAVDVRQELDLRTGAAFTRLQTLRLQKVFPQKLGDKVISYGSCQFPTLGFVVERYQAIEDFIAEPFWRIKMLHTVKDVTTDFSWKRDRLFDKNSCEAILDICKENPTATVESVESKEKSKWRPTPLDTVEMEKTVSRKLKINAKETMSIAERLYNQGFISYPRTETNIFPKELNLSNLVQNQQNDARWGPFAQRIMNEGGPTPRQGRKSDQAHPPIHPIKYAPNLGGNDQRVYEYIVRHFLACVHKDAKGFETTVNADVAGEKFTAKGLIILEKNYLDVYIYDKWNTKEINNYRVGETFLPTVLDIVESSTSPPKLLTEADLIALMEKHGIGTDATHADHIDKIKSREYVGLHENIYFVPGTLGMGLVEGYNNIGLEVSLAKPILRAQFETELRQICDGLRDPEAVRRDQISKYRAVFQTVCDKLRLIDASLAHRLDDRPAAVPDDAGVAAVGGGFAPVLKCPRCGSDMVLRNKKNGPGQMLTCLEFPNCRNTVWFPAAVDKVEVLDDHCPNCGQTSKKVKMKFKQNLFPGDPNPNILCLGGCDMNVLETLDINISAVNQRRPANTPQRTANAAPQQTVVAPQRTANVAPQRTANVAPPTRPNTSNNAGDATRSFRDSGYRAGNTAQPRTSGSSSQPNGSHSAGALTSMVPRPRTSAGGNDGISGTAGNEEEIVCACNNPARLLTVRKDGPNKGRNFYKCAGDICNFFCWAPDADGTATTIPNTQRHDPATRGVVCNCRQPAVQRTVAKDGPNKGRQFYACAKPMSEKCNFFQWADDEDGGGGGGGGDDDRWGGGGNNSNWTGRGQSNRGRNPRSQNKAPRGKRKCGICGEEGHIRTRCPNKN